MIAEGEPIRILLADEHALFREALRTGLENSPDLQVVGEARTGPEAVAEAEQTHPHVAIIDIDLPITDGPRTTALIKERVPACRVLVLGSNEDHWRLTQVLEAGATGYLTKEAPLAELVSSTRAVHQGGTLVPPRMLGPLLASLLKRRRERDQAYQRISRLTRREREVLTLLADGADNETIARALVISPQTVRTHIQNILGKLKAHSRLEAVAFARGSGLLDDISGLELSRGA